MKASTALFASVIAICCTVSLALSVSPSNAQSNELPPLFKVNSKIYMQSDKAIIGEPVLVYPSLDTGWIEVQIHAIQGQWVQYLDVNHSPVARTWIYAPNRKWRFYAPTISR